MKREVYIGILVTITVICVMIGVVMNMSKNFTLFSFFDRSGKNISREFDEAAGGFTAIELDADIGDVTIEKGSAFAVKFSGLDKLEPRVSVSDGKLSVIQDTEVSFNPAKLKSNISITVPEGTNLTELKADLDLGNLELEGISAACSGTVNGRLVKNVDDSVSPAVTTYGTNVLAIMGDFSLIRWGFVRDIMAEVIEFGDPDGQGDLKRYNQIAFRTEAVLAWAVIDPAAFAILHSGAAA